MEDSNTIPPDHRELIQSLIDGTLDPIESPRVNSLLRDDIVLREFYIRQIRTDEQLHAHFEETNPQIQLSRPEPHISKRKHITAIAASVTLGMAAAIALMFTFWKDDSLSKTNLQDIANYSEFIPAPNRTPIAQISGAQNVIWSNASGDLHPGQWLSAGKIELKEGLIELSYDSGSTVLIKAPAIYYIEAQNKGYLEKGSIRAHSPKTVATFEIETPNSQLIDLGTTFGVSVLSTLSTEVHVLEGLVKAKSLTDSDSEWKTLIKGKALRIDNSNRSNSSDDFNTDYTRFPADISLYEWAPPARAKRATPVEFAHWSFDGMQNNQFPETGNFAGNQSFPASPKDFSSSPGEYSWLTEGPFNQALRLDGKRRFLSTDFPGIGGTQARTVAFWLRLGPDQPKEKDSPGIVAWGQNRTRGAKWQILPYSPLLEPNQKVLRTECAHGHSMGSTNIDDGKWHHVVSVFMGGDKADVATHVRHYVDGRLESRGSVISRRVNTAISDSKTKHIPLVVGLTIHDVRTNNFDQFLELCSERGVPFKSLHGDIDELYVFDVALTPQEILHLMETNEVPK